MKYNLANNIDLTKFNARSEQLTKQGAFIELKKINPVGSNAQKRYLHVILGFFAVEYGETLDYVKQVMFKQLVNKDIFKTEYKNIKNGQVRDEWRSTSDLNTAELTLAIDRFRDYSSKEAYIYLPLPGEEEWLKYCEVEIEKNKQYL